MGVDEMGVDEVGVDDMGSRRSGKTPKFSTIHSAVAISKKPPTPSPLNTYTKKIQSSCHLEHSNTANFSSKSVPCVKFLFIQRNMFFFYLVFFFTY